MQKSWIVTCFVNFLIAALMGTMLRFTNVVPQHFDYANLIHAHSHTAMLGWVYLVIFCLFVQHFVAPEKHKNYNRIFWLTQAAVVGMMISFPLQGYAAVSIAFSTLHILCSYVFCYRILKDQRATSNVKTFLYTALFFMVLSTLGAWSLGFVAKFVGKNSALYKSAIQFFLHFQFNGWFVFAVLAVFFSTLQSEKIYARNGLVQTFYFMLAVSSILTFALPLSWNFPNPAFFYVNCFAVVLQAASMVYFIRLVQPEWQALNSRLGAKKWLIALPVASLVVKMTMQVLTILPGFAYASKTIRNFTVGFIHLGMLGLITGFLFFFLTRSNFIRRKRLWLNGALIFYTGFLLTELLLFLQGMGTFLKYEPLPQFPPVLFIATLLLPIGLLLMLIAFTAPEKQK